ncbi:MAG: hypothetical protein Q9182_001893 [Xanthomendoza sp. 2 TL-2023]
MNDLQPNKLLNLQVVWLSLTDPELLYKAESTWIAVESECAAALALKVANQPAQHRVFAPTARAVIELLTMHRTFEMLIQATQGTEAILTQVTAIRGSVPGGTCGQSRGSLIVIVPANLFVGKDVARINLAAVLIDFRAIDTRGASARLEVDADTCQVSELIGTPRTLDILSSMDRRLEMLFHGTISSTLTNSLAYHLI